MNTHTEKTQENKSQAVTNSLLKQQSNSESAFQFVDNRPEAIAQRKLQEANKNSFAVQQFKAYQEMADNSPQLKQLRTYQAMANNFTFETTQRKENVEEETLQGKFEPIQKKENNTGLPDNLKSGIENLSGISMDDVKVHYNSSKPAQVQAHAYAQGTDIHLASGQEEHLPHEAWHVVQQKQDRVKPTLQLKGNVNINDDVGLEKEADVMGEKAMQRHINKLEPHEDDVVIQNKSWLSNGFHIGNQMLLQRQFLIGSNWIEPYDAKLVTQQYTDVKPYIKQWGAMDEIFKKQKKSETTAAKSDYVDNVLEGDILALLRKYNNKKSFLDSADLTRQLTQDVKLKLLGMNSIVGIDNLDGQFSEKVDDSTAGRTGKSKTLKIYRTMKMEDWKTYLGSKDPKDILKGHGGSLGQALHYFLKSKTDKIDDALVEFEFTSNASNLVDYNEIQSGGEGKAPKGGKLTGKSEQNDVMDLDEDIFSVNLGKSKELITTLNPKITLIDKVL